MKRMMGTGLVAMLLAVTVQAQGTGLTAAGSNFTGPGGGGSGTSSTIGAFLPTTVTSTGGFSGSTGMPTGGPGASFATATAPANVQVGNLSVSVPADAQQAAAGAVTSGNTAAFTASLGTAVPGPQAAALGSALSSLGDGARTSNPVQFATALGNAIAAFNAAVNAMPPGTPVPASLIAARALIASYYQ